MMVRISLILIGCLLAPFTSWWCTRGKTRGAETSHHTLWQPEASGTGKKEGCFFLTERETSPPRQDV